MTSGLTPEQFLQNAQALVTVLLPILAGLAALVGTAMYVAGKTLSQARLCSWGRGGWIGALVGFAATGLIAVLRNVGQRLGGGA